MSAGLSSQISSLYTRYTSLGANLKLTADALTAAGNASSWGNAQYFLKQAGEKLTLAANDIYGASSGVQFWTNYLFGWINDNWPEEPEPPVVTMDSILTSMLGATFNQLQNFIGIEDAYRVALWNAPFNADYYAALARGFIKWS